MLIYSLPLDLRRWELWEAFLACSSSERLRTASSYFGSSICFLGTFFSSFRAQATS